jgi:molybdopterin-guanine dinucleotide biosynthesis protein A
MKNAFRGISCFVLATNKAAGKRHFEPAGDITRLEKSYRHYAKLFERVTLVLSPEQVNERYLNYPHVTDDRSREDPAHAVETALKHAPTDTVFIGSSDIDDFPLHLVVDLVRHYDGEPFLGYQLPDDDERAQPLFGIYSREFAARLAGESLRKADELRDFAAREGRLIPLPEDVQPDVIGLSG